MNSLRGQTYYNANGTGPNTIPPVGTNFSLKSLAGTFSENPNLLGVLYTSGTPAAPLDRPTPTRFDIYLIGGGGGGAGGGGGYNCDSDIRVGGGGGGASSGVISSSVGVQYNSSLLFTSAIYGAGCAQGGGGYGTGCPSNPVAGNEAQSGGNGIGPTSTNSTSVSYNGIQYTAAGGNQGNGGSGGGYNGSRGISYDGSGGPGAKTAGNGSVPGTQGTGYPQNPGSGGVPADSYWKDGTTIHGKGGDGGGGSTSNGSGGAAGAAGAIYIIWYFT